MSEAQPSPEPPEHDSNEPPAWLYVAAALLAGIVGYVVTSRSPHPEFAILGGLLAALAAISGVFTYGTLVEAIVTTAVIAGALALWPKYFVVVAFGFPLGIGVSIGKLASSLRR